MEVIGDGVVVDFRNAAFLRAQDTGKVTEVINGQRQVGGHRFADGLAVVPGFRRRQQFQVLFHPVGDAQQHQRPFGGRGLAPLVLGGMGCIKRGFDILGARPGDLADFGPGDGRGVGEIAARFRRRPLPADEVVVTLGKGHHAHALELVRLVVRHIFLLWILPEVSLSGYG